LMGGVGDFGGRRICVSPIISIILVDTHCNVKIPKCTLLNNQ
jgi:hypothetical protein